MSILKKGISISLLALPLLGSAIALAGPGGRDPGERGASRAAQQQDRAMDFNRRQFEERRQGPGPGAEGQEKHGKMSPEQRRTLRQQINEANQDIRTPKR